MILSIETSTRVCAVALSNELSLLGEQRILIQQSHSSLIMRLIDDLLSYCQVKKSELQAVAVSAGPGSYTGLRIGHSVAKAIAQNLEIPLIAIPTLEGMAHQVAKLLGEWARLVPMIDARRMEVYEAQYQVADDGTVSLLKTPSAKIIDVNSYSAELSAGLLYFFGDGSAKVQELLGNHKNFRHIAEIEPSASSLAVLAYRKYGLQQFENVVDLKPDYFKAFYSPPPRQRS